MTVSRYRLMPGRAALIGIGPVWREDRIVGIAFSIGRHGVAFHRRSW